MTQSPIRVVIADDQPVVRAGFAAILDAQPDIEVRGEAANGREAVEVVRRVRPDVVLMDVRMPEMDGIAATAALAGPGVADRVRVLVLTTFDLDEHVYDALRAGASGFLLKDATRVQLVDAVRTIAAGDALLAPSVTRRLLDRLTDVGPRPDATSALAVLTDRERDVLELIASGLSNAEIASELIIGEATVKTHVNRLFAKLGLRDRVQAVILAYELGLIVPGDRRADER